MLCRAGSQLLLLFLAMVALLAPHGGQLSGLKVAVVGPTGRVGRLVVRQLVEEGHSVRILLRHEVCGGGSGGGEVPVPAAPEGETRENVAAYLVGLPGVEAVRGDINDRSSLDELLLGCTAVLAVHGAQRVRKLSDFWRDATLDPEHAKNVNYEGVKNLIAAARASTSCKRIVRITGQGEDPLSIFSILINFMGGMAKAWNYEAERELRATTDLKYTIVRPGILIGEETNLEPKSLALVDNGAKLKTRPIPRESIARLCIEVLKYPNTARATLAAMQTESPGEGESSWSPLLAKVQPDRRAFRDDLLQAHFRAVRFGVPGIALALFSFAVGILTTCKALLVAIVGLVRKLSAD